MQVSTGALTYISVVVRRDGGLNCVVGTKAFHLSLVCLSSGHCGSPPGPHTHEITHLYICVHAHNSLKPNYVREYKDTEINHMHTQEHGDGVTAGKRE